MSPTPVGFREPANAAGIPLFGLGTYGRTGAKGLAALRFALDVGYRHLDTAQTYGAEANVGLAVRESGLPREGVFITTKIADYNLGSGRVIGTLRESLKAIGVEQVDLTLIHWPSHLDEVPMASFLTELLRAKRDGLTRLIGVSNFTVALLKRAVDLIGAEEIATNQVEAHPYLQNRKLRSFSDGLGIVTTAYMPLARGAVASDPAFIRIAEGRVCTPAAVSLAWLVSKGMAVIPASGRREHLQSNLGAVAVKLTPKESAQIDALDRGRRIIDPPKAPAWDV